MEDKDRKDRREHGSDWDGTGLRELVDSAVPLAGPGSEAHKAKKRKRQKPHNSLKSIQEVLDEHLDNETVEAMTQAHCESVLGEGLTAGEARASQQQTQASEWPWPSSSPHYTRSGAYQPTVHIDMTLKEWLDYLDYQEALCQVQRQRRVTVHTGWVVLALVWLVLIAWRIT